MSDLPSKQLNESFLLHGFIFGRRVVGVHVEELPGKQEEVPLSFYYCEVEGNVANMVVPRSVNTPYKYGPDYKDNFDCWIEQIKVQLPSLALIGKSTIWDPCQSCKNDIEDTQDINKKGSLTVSLERCERCYPIQNKPVVRSDWGKDPKALPDKVDEIRSNNNYVVFYNHLAESQDAKHQFRILKWSELEKGNFTGMGVAVPLPKEVWNIKDCLGDFLLNRQDQLCALWANGSLFLCGRFAKLETFKDGEWISILELKFKKNRYLVVGIPKLGKSSRVITLINSQAQVLSSLKVKIESERSKLHLFGSSTLIYCHAYLEVIAIRRDRLIAIAKQVPIFEQILYNRFIPTPNSRKRDGIVMGDLGRIASVKFRYG